MQLSSKARKAIASGLAASTMLWAAGMGVVPQIASAAVHSNGCLVLSGGTVWLITNGTRRGFTSAEVFMSAGYNFLQVVPATAEDIALPVGPIMVYADGTLVKGPNDPLIYLVVSGQKRGFVSGSVFTNLGYMFANVKVAPANTFADLPTGANIDANTSGNSLPSSGPAQQTVACTTTGTGSPSGDLQGGAGDITVSDLSTYSGEEVGEGESNVKVLAFEVEADSGSDVRVTSVKVELQQNTGADSEDLADYADNVAIYQGSTKVGDADVDEFSEDSDLWSKSISLSNAVVRADDTESFSIAISALDNLDSGDIDTDAWDIGVASVRFIDAEGVTTTEALTLDVTDGVDDDDVESLFDFASFTTAADVELEVALNDDDDDINEAHVINVDDTDETEDETILSFTLESTGDSDINVTEMDVNVDVTGAANVDDMITAITLWHDGSEIDSASVGSGVGADETYVFDDVDENIGAGDTEEYMVKVDLKSTGDVDLDAGDTISAQVSGTEIDLFEAEDESGEDLAAGDLVGTAVGEASEVRDVGIMVELTDTDAVISSTSDGTAGVSDAGTFTITFEVTAFDGDAYVDLSAPLAAGGSGEADLGVTGTGTVVSTIDCPACDEGTNGFLVNEGETETFTITTNITATASGFFAVELDNLVYALTDIDGNLSYTFNLDEFKTDQIFLRDF